LIEIKPLRCAAHQISSWLADACRVRLAVRIPEPNKFASRHGSSCRVVEYLGAQKELIN
jgi:hypothetical protein